MLQGNHLYLAVADLVDAADDADQAFDVDGAVGNDQHVGGRVGRQVSLLRHQRPQDRHQLCRGHIVHLYHAGDHFITTTRRRIVGGGNAVLLGIHVRYDLDHFAAGNGSEAVHLENRQEHLVNLVAVHRPGGHHRDLALDARVDDEIAVGNLGNRADQCTDVRILEVQCHRLGMQLRNAQPPCQQHPSKLS